MLYMIVGVVICIYACLVGLAISSDPTVISHVYVLLRTSIFVDEQGKIPEFHATKFVIFFLADLNVFSRIICV